MGNKISKQELFFKLNNLTTQDLKKLNISIDEINYIKNKLLNDKLGLILNYNEIDEELKNNYFVLEEVKELHINPKEENNNLIIEGDNYYALKALQAANLKVDLIYIDPPYNTGNKDFIYNDSFVEKEDEYKHSKWLSFMKKRLTLARELLSDDGVIFISIDDNEQAYLKVLMDEIFGEDNFISNIIWHARRGGGNDVNNIAVDHEYIICYSKIKLKNNLVGINKDSNDYSFEDEYVNKRGRYNLQQFDRASLTYTKSLDYPIIAPDGTTIYPGHSSKEKWIKRINNNEPRNDWRWMMSEKTFKKAKENDFIVFNYNKIKKIWNVRVKTYQFINYKNENLDRKKKLRSILTDEFGITMSGNKLIKNLNIKFSYPKPSNLLKNLIKYFNNKNAIILDFFAGSGTTAQAVMELNQEDNGNRRFILVTNNENNIAKEVCRERIYRVINGVGSNKEKIDWVYSDEIKSLNNNHVKYLKVKHIHNVNGEYEEINDCKEIYKKEFNKEISIKDFIDN